MNNKRNYDDFLILIARRVSARSGYSVTAYNVAAIFWAINEYIGRKLFHNEIVYIKNFFSIYMVRRQNITREGFFVKFVLHKKLRDFLRSRAEKNPKSS